MSNMMKNFFDDDEHTFYTHNANKNCDRKFIFLSNLLLSSIKITKIYILSPKKTANERSLKKSDLFVRLEPIFLAFSRLFFQPSRKKDF